jgi:hypothetical protein
MNESTGQGQTLLHTLAIAGYLLTSPARDIQGLQLAIDPRRHLCPRYAIDLGIDLQILTACQALIQRRRLGEDTCAPAKRGTLGRRFEVEDACIAAVSSEHAVEQSNAGCLAGAIVSQETEHFPCVHLEAQMIDGHNWAKAASKTIDYNDGIRRHLYSLFL